MRPPKLLIFGIDGATWDVLGPLIASGRAPTFARLVRDGASGPLRSTIHPHSPTAWASFLTGMNPGKHGIFDFVRRRAGSYEIEVLSARDRSGSSVWQILSQAGVSCGVLNVPLTYPPEKVDGYFVSGAFSSAALAGFTFPPALLSDVERALGRPYRVDSQVRDFARMRRADALLAWAEDLKGLMRDRTAVSLYLLRRFAPRFLTHVVTSIDRAQHHFWRYHDGVRAESDGRHPLASVIQDLYEAADADLATLWDAMGEDTTVVVLSDHGAGPLKRAIFLNAWLEEEGYLLRRAVSPARVARRLAWETYRKAVRRLPAQARRRLMDRLDMLGVGSLKHEGAPTIDWARTRAFSEGTFGSIRLNVRGRFPMGVVDRGREYETLRAEIRAKLESLADPDTGTRVVERTYDREELYHGPRVDEAPDVVAALTPGYHMVGDMFRRRFGRTVHGQVFGQDDGGGVISGIHAMDGIFLACGPQVEGGVPVEGAEIIDIAPTVLRFFGVTPPAAMDGSPLRALAGTGKAAGAAR